MILWLLCEGTGKDKEIVLNDELKVMVSTVYGEADASSEHAWEAIANVMMNRVGTREWRKYESILAVIKNSGFDAYTYRNSPYRVAEDYLENRDEYIKNGKINETIENMIKVVGDVYYRNTEDITDGAVLYYSPNTQAIMHKKNPKLYKEVPPWNFDALKEVLVEGAENDDFRFFKYK